MTNLEFTLNLLESARPLTTASVVIPMSAKSTKNVLDGFAKLKPDLMGHYKSGAVWPQPIQPRGNRVLIKRIEEPSEIMLTDAPKGIKGVILSCGPGKWHPGEWRKTKKKADPLCDPAGEWWKQDINPDRAALKFAGEWFEWTWISGWREPMEVKPGDLVLFNSKWNDLAHAENKGTGADGAGPLERPLSYKLDDTVHLVTEDDIFCIISKDVPASYVGTAVEAQYFKNTSTAEECFQRKVGPR